jgi:hypothetical protein
MRELKTSSVLLASCCLLVGAVTAHAQTTNHVTVDPSKTWQGFMNWSPSAYTVANFPGGGGTGNSAWGTADLQASFSGAQATLLPCKNVYDSTSDPYWVNPDGTGANNMDANFYVESTPTSATPLGGSDVVFSGYCWANTLVAPYGTNMTAFIKEFTPGFALVGSATVQLTNGQPFSIQWNSSTGNVVQYGFEMIGPDANPATISTLGFAIVSSNPPPAGPIVGQLAPTTYVTITSNLTITANASGGSGTLNYQWQKNGVNLANGPGVSGATNASLTVSNVTGAAEANYTIKVKDSLNQSATSSTYAVVFNPSDLTLDRHATFLGFINFSDTSFNYIGGFAYPTALLRGGVGTNGVASLQPNIDLYVNGHNYNGGYAWTNSDGTPNANLEQDFYIENDALSGNTLTFSGFCPSNSIDPSYTASAWIEDFAPNFSSLTPVNTTLVAGQPFSITLATTLGDHIQYGIRLVGLDNSPSSPLTTGTILVTIAHPTLNASVTGGMASLSFTASSSFNYTVQFKTNLTDTAWQTLTSTPGNGATQTVTDSANHGQRFYRLSIQ